MHHKGTLRSHLYSGAAAESNMDSQKEVLPRIVTIIGILSCLILFARGRAFAGQCETNGACYVTPAGAGAANGVDWNNAYAGLPTSWSSANCGVTYYVAGGTYDYTSTSNTISSACTSGSPLIIYKAVSGGPGNPQNIAGWSASFGTSQALFSQTANADPEAATNPLFTLSGTYITIDGVIPTSGAPSKTATFGIHLQTANDLNNGFVYVTGANNTVKHVEFDGVQSSNQYGYQITACSRSSNTVTLAVNGTPAWANGDTVDVYMNGGTPTDFNISHVAITISGSTITYTQAGSNETCSPATASTVTLNAHAASGIFPDMTANPANFVLTDNYIHDIAVPLHFGTHGCNNGCSILRDYWARNRSTPTQHSEAIGGDVLNGSSIGQNIFEDISGTSVTTPVCGISCNWTNDVIYSNLVFCTIASQSAYYPGSGSAQTWQTPQCTTSDIFGDDQGGNEVTNTLVYGNTIVRPNYGCFIRFLNASSTATVINNFLYCPNGDSFTIIIGDSTGPSNHSYNSGWASLINRAPSPGTADYFTTTFPAATSVFVDPSDAGENFRLISNSPETSCSEGTNCIDNGLTLGFPYNVDLAGTPRVSGHWSRGAYQFVSTAAPEPPTNLRVTGVY